MGEILYGNEIVVPEPDRFMKNELIDTDFYTWHNINKELIQKKIKKWSEGDVC